MGQVKKYRNESQEEVKKGVKGRSHGKESWEGVMGRNEEKESQECFHSTVYNLEW